MKIKELLFGMLACTALVACSNDDDPVNGGENELANSYMAVKISDATRASSRAAGDYDEGESVERTIKKADFFFYEEGGRFVALVQKTFDSQTSVGGNISDKAQVLVLEKTQLKPVTLITLVNSPIDATTLRGKSFNEMKAVISNLEALEGYQEDNKFFMTSSSYFANNSLVYGTDVSNSLQETADAASNNPVNVYVERLAAKATVAFTESEKEIPSQIVDETPQTIKVRLKGWGLNGTNKDSYLVKNLEGFDFAANSWASSNDYRSFWAIDNNYAEGTYATIYKDMLTKGEDGSFSDENYDESRSCLTYISANDANLEHAASQYCLENTSTTLLSFGKANPYTTVTIIAEVILQGKETAETIYKYKGAYYTESNLKNVALKVLADYRKANPDAESEEKFIALDASDIAMVDAWADSNNEVKFELTGETYYNESDTETAVAAATLNATLAELGNSSCFEGGLCYYNVPIEHFGVVTETENGGKYGMVRNHSYVLNVKSINNVGEAVYKPGAPIIPTIPETPQDFYLSTTLNVLSWKIVSQDIEL